MKRLTLGIVLSRGARRVHGAGAVAGKPLAAQSWLAANIAAGKAFVEPQCKGCHGARRRGRRIGDSEPGGATRALSARGLKAYKEGKRSHAALREITTNMSDADARNVAAYYASPAAGPAGSGDGKNAELLSPYEHGKALAAACAKCHGEDGNSTIAGIPSLAGQQPQYLVVAIQEYLNEERKAAPMHALLPGLTQARHGEPGAVFRLAGARRACRARLRRRRRPASR